MTPQDLEAYVSFRPQFADVIDERYHTLEWLDQQILRGEFRFWHSPNAALVTEFRTYPTGARAIHAMIAAGDLDEIIGELMPQTEQWAREQGCIAAIVESRAGWARCLRPYGYETHQVIVRKEF